jgi:excisionase family DNA binding protein
VSVRPVPRVALRPEEAAVSLGLSRSTFYDRVLPELRTVLVGTARLVPVVELERWVEREARRLGAIEG